MFESYLFQKIFPPQFFSLPNTDDHLPATLLQIATYASCIIIGMVYFIICKFEDGAHGYLIAHDIKNKVKVIRQIELSKIELVVHTCITKIYYCSTQYVNPIPYSYSKIYSQDNALKVKFTATR